MKKTNTYGEFVELSKNGVDFSRTASDEWLHEMAAEYGDLLIKVAMRRNELEELIVAAIREWGSNRVVIGKRERKTLEIAKHIAGYIILHDAEFAKKIPSSKAATIDPLAQTECSHCGACSVTTVYFGEERHCPNCGSIWFSGKQAEITKDEK